MRKTRNKLTRQQYSDKFDKQMERFNYIKQPGEVILQCNAPYPDYWFLSNKGYLFSAYFDDARIVKPNYRETGVKNKEGKRPGQDWYYEYAVVGEKNNRKISMHKLMAEMFVEDEFVSAEKRHTHHIQKRTSFDENQPQFCNRAENLQRIPTSIHVQATYYGSKTMEELDKETQKKIEDSGCPQFFLNQQQLLKILESALKSSMATGVQPYIIMTTVEDDVSKIKVDVQPVKSFSFDGEQNNITVNM